MLIKHSLPPEVNVLLQGLCNKLVLSVKPIVEAIIYNSSLTMRDLTILELWKQTLSFSYCLSLGTQLCIHILKF